MEKINIIKIAEEISFRLLATKNHNDFNWLINKLNSVINSNDYVKEVVQKDKIEEDYNQKKYTEEEWKRELDLNIEMAKELLAHQKSTPANRNWEDLAYDLIQLQKKSRIPTNIEFFKDYIKSQENNELPNSSSGSFFTGLTDIDGLLSAMNFEEYDEETNKELYTDEEYTTAAKYHISKINQEIPDWYKY